MYQDTPACWTCWGWGRSLFSIGFFPWSSVVLLSLVLKLRDSGSGNPAMEWAPPGFTYLVHTDLFSCRQCSILLILSAPLCSIKYPKTAISGKAGSAVLRLVFCALVLLQKWGFFELVVGFFCFGLVFLHIPSRLRVLLVLFSRDSRAVGGAQAFIVSLSCGVVALGQLCCPYL